MLARPLNAEAESRRGSEASVKTLRFLVTAIQGLAELRDELGLGHGRVRPRPRSAGTAGSSSTP
ncbi:MAG TPA: hypothetical protein VGR11_09455 [Solirubrobacteraceae bacterium]|nr:hypothetical protein [Solirubrobacteraceae bacterium]